LGREAEACARTDRATPFGAKQKSGPRRHRYRFGAAPSVDLPRDRQLRLELTDPPLRRNELHRLVCAQAGDLTSVDAILLDPHIDRRFAHPERHGELRNTRSGAREFDDLTTDL